MRNNIKENTIDQAKSKAFCLTELLHRIKSLAPSRRKTLNQLIKYGCYYANVFPSQSKIGQDTGNVRQTVNEAASELESLGLIDTTYYHRQTKSYRIALFFSNPFIRSALLGILPALSMLPIYGCLSSFSRKDDTNLYKNNLLLNSYSSYTKNSTSDELILKNRETKKVEELKKERLTTNVHKIFYDETYPGDVYVSKYHKREVRKSMTYEAAKSQPQSTKKLFPNALLGRAKDILEKAQKGKITRFRAKRDLKICRDAFPEGIPTFTQWYNSQEGLALKQWLSEVD